MTLLFEINAKKLCFMHCGENCNCEIGMDWKLSEITVTKLEEIDENLRNALINADRLVVGDKK